MAIIYVSGLFTFFCRGYYMLLSMLVVYSAFSMGVIISAGVPFIYFYGGNYGDYIRIVCD